MDVLNDKKRYLTQENIDVDKNGKRFERKWISPNRSRKQRHKNQSYQSENGWDATK